MPYPIDEKLVIAVASSALFDLTDSDRVYREHGVEAYRQYQRDHEADVLSPGVAFPLVKRILSLNGATEDDRPVEVILLSRNDPDTGLRVFRSIERHGLDITRAAFVSGRNPFRYLGAYNAALFMSANEKDVEEAARIGGAPAVQVFPTKYVDDFADPELRIAFDFDGVLTDNSAEAIYKLGGLMEFHRSEREKAAVAMAAGPLHRFFTEVAKLQRRERTRRQTLHGYTSRVRIAIVTARNAPAHERVVTTLRVWGIQADEVFFLGGIEKSRVLKEFKPHIFFDDQVSHITGVAEVAPSAHVPFVAHGVMPNLAQQMSPEAAISAGAGAHSEGFQPPHRD